MMRRLLATLAIALLPVAAASARSSSVPLPLPARATVQAAFTPGDDIEGLLVETIGGARRQVLVQAYLMTNKPIARALAAARRRGVDVRVLADAEQLERTGPAAVELMRAAGIPVWLETRYRNAHNKIIVIDAGTPAATVVTGSFNFTWTAQHKNAENVLIVHGDPALAARYADNWERHQRDATPYEK